MTTASDLVRWSAEREPVRPLSSDALRWRCPPLRPSRHRPALIDLLGQERPLNALRTGFDLRAPGYHVFVSGLTGSGRTALVKDLIEELQPGGVPGPDRAYVNNLREPHRPRLMTLPRGRAPAFRKDMEDLVLRTQDALQGALGSRPHKLSRRLALQRAEARERRLMDGLSRIAAAHGCALVQVSSSSGVAVDIHPQLDGEPRGPQALAALVADGSLKASARDALLARRAALLPRLEAACDLQRQVHRRTEHRLRAMDRQLAARIIEDNFREFRARWPQLEVAQYLEEVQACVERDLELWVAAEGEAGPFGADSSASGEERGSSPRLSQTHLHDLSVHVIQTPAEDGACPIVVENNPTYANLFGAIESPRDGDPWSLAMIHPGALLRADGGYLVLRVGDVLAEPGMWAQLKRALKAGVLEIREYDPGAGTTTGGLQPEAIPIDLKVVLIGELGAYEQLATQDAEFLQVFKVHAEFDTAVPASMDNLQRYADFLSYLSGEEGLRAFAPEATAAVIEEGARRAGRRDLLTTRFGEIGDLAREASLCCERGGLGPVLRAHVRDAVRARQHRLDLAREHVERDLHDGYLLIGTRGKAVGQVNSLTVMDTGTFAFGKPCRITASTGIGGRGKSGVVNIERESDLSGSLHDKGVMILSGFLLDQFAQDGALCLQATLCFEQNYGGVDGDSASSAELYALLSSLSRVPLDQGIGVTGSVNQKGAIQAVSAVNEKIEGFFRLCKAAGFTGEQGVVIPRVNVADLMLDEEVVEAAELGLFTVWAVDHVEEGLRVLTGIEPDEVMRRVAKTLRRFRERSL